MKRNVLISLAAAGLVFGATACSAADRASSNISQAAENFKVFRQVTVINDITNSVSFQAVGAFSYENEGGEWLFTFKMKDGSFKRHTILAGDNTTAVIEDLEGVEGADAWIYKVFYLPEQPVRVELEK